MDTTRITPDLEPPLHRPTISFVQEKGRKREKKSMWSWPTNVSGTCRVIYMSSAVQTIQVDLDVGCSHKGLCKHHWGSRTRISSLIRECKRYINGLNKPVAVRFIGPAILILRTYLFRGTRQQVFGISSDALVTTQAIRIGPVRLRENEGSERKVTLCFSHNLRSTSGRTQSGVQCIYIYS